MDVLPDVHALLGERCTTAKRAPEALQGLEWVVVQLGRTLDSGLAMCARRCTRLVNGPNPWYYPPTCLSINLLDTLNMPSFLIDTVFDEVS